MTGQYWLLVADLHAFICCLPAQVKAGSIFDNIIVTDDFAAAKKFAEDTWGKIKEAEKKMFDKVSEVSTRTGAAHVCCWVGEQVGLLGTGCDE